MASSGYPAMHRPPRELVSARPERSSAVPYAVALSADAAFAGPGPTTSWVLDVSGRGDQALRAAYRDLRPYSPPPKARVVLRIWISRTTSKTRDAALLLTAVATERF